MTACLIPTAERIVVFGLDFSMLRIVLIFALVRFLVKPAESKISLNNLDRLVLLWCAVGTLAYCIGTPTFSAFVYRLGYCFEIIIVYFLGRILIRNYSDAQAFTAHFGTVATLIALGVIYELNTRFNLFSLLGGVPETTWIRDGRFRCQGAFSHPIMLGAFGATTLPLFVGLYFSAAKYRVRAFLGIVSSLVIVFGSASSGPLFALVGALGGLLLWPFRGRMTTFQLSLAAILIFLHLIREKPVWHLIGRLSDLVGGTGYHRYQLIDAFIHRFNEWALFGSKNVANWGWGLQDITNQYVLEGVRGGFATLTCFVLLLVVAFRVIGQTTANGNRNKNVIWAWAVGSCIAAHTLCFVGVSYFGQLIAILMLHLSLVSAMNEVNQSNVARPLKPAKHVQSESQLIVLT